MTNKGQINSEELKIQGLIDRYLRFRSSKAISDSHLDEDSLNAFIEGKLSNRETQPILQHLVDCAFCLHVTSELASLEFAFADEDATNLFSDAQPTKISDVLNNLLSRIFGTNDGAVFAHHETEEPQATEKEEDKKEN